MTEPSEHELDPLDFGELGDLEKREPVPSASKLSQSDPSLKVAAARGRQLRKPAVRLALAVFAAIVGISFAAASKGRTVVKAPKEDDPFSKPVIPQAILNAPEHAAAPTVVHAAAAAPMAPMRAEEQPAVPDEHPRALGRSTAKLEDAQAHQLAEEEERARQSSGLVQAGPPPPVPVEALDTSAGLEPSGRDGAAQLVAAPLGLGQGTGAPGVLGDGDPNMQGRKNAYLGGTEVPESGYLRARVQHPRSPFELKPGTIVPAVLETAINSDLPGPVIARVRENVCDSVQGKYLLIPQGSILVAYYDSMVAWGQERVLVCWKQLELPNGDSLDLGCMPAADSMGQAGLQDEVDEHWWRIIKGAAISSLLSAATTAAAGNTEGYNPTVPQMFARGAATEIGNVGQAITRRNIMIQPTLRVRQGMPVNVIVTKTIDFSPDGPPTSCGSQQ